MSRALPDVAPDKTSNSSNEQPKKRVRLSEEAHGSIFAREITDVETNLEVDYMILDYLTYQAIETCFTNTHATRMDDEVTHVDRSLLQVDEFHRLFKHRYAKYRIDAQLRFRQQVLQLVTLTTQRLVRNSTTPNKERLKIWRESNWSRAFGWIGSEDRIPSRGHDVSAFETHFPLAQEELEQARIRILEERGVPAEDEAYDDAFYGTSASVSLLDLLPLFMRVSAACHMMFDSNLTQQWMGLAAEWMLQACLENYLVFGADGSDTIDQAFAWGFSQKAGEEGSVEKSCDDPFATDYEEQDVREWDDIKSAALARLFRFKEGSGDSRDAVQSLLRKTSSDLPNHEFEEKVMGFLQSLARCIPKPVLVQLEKGQLHGLSEDDTQKFLRSCGLDVLNFCNGTALPGI